MTDVNGKITVEVDSEDINSLMEKGAVRVPLSDGPVEVVARCTDSLQFEVVTDE
jgi:hypothetical protein